MRRALAVVVLAAASLTEAARADDTHHAPYPLGGRAAALAGAGCATADAVGALYYNPAGLADARGGSVQLSTSLYGLDFSLDSGGLGDVASTLVDLKRLIAELQIVPSAAGVVRTFGPRDASGEREHAIGLAAFVRDQRSLRADSTSRDESGEQRYARDFNDRSLVLSAGYAGRVTPRLRLGVALAIDYRSTSDREQASLATPDGSGFTRGESSLDLSTGELGVTAGLRWSFDPRWTLGVALSLPTFRLFGSARLRTIETRGGPSPSFSVLEQEELVARSPLPTLLRLGLAWVVTEDTRIALDVAIAGPVDYQLIQLDASTSALARRQSFALDVERRTTVNFALGAEHALGPRWQLSGGVFTDLSSAPPITGASGDVRSTDLLPAVDRVGFSIGTGVQADITRTWIGLFGVYGFGRDAVLTRRELRPLGEARSFAIVDVQQLSLFVMVSSALAL